MSAPAISLITPTRNRANLLLRTVENVRTQRLEEWEMVVIDDGDGSGIGAVQELNDPRVRAFQNPGAGQVDARNAGVRLARGEVIHLLDDDDRWLDAHHLERVLDLLSSTVGLVYRAGWLVEEEQRDGVWVETQRLPFNPPTSAASLRTDNTLLTSGVAYPKALHETLGAFDRDLENYWDWDWFLRVSAQYPLLPLEPPGVLMSWRGSSGVTNTSRDPFEPRRVALLNALCEKHKLGSIPPKNHRTVIQPALETAPEV
jgi:glycosyltransferase involved in cell wall biosynthesis